MFISGCIKFKGKKMKLKIWKELKQEFGDRVKIFIQDDLITYSCKTDRNHI